MEYLKKGQFFGISKSITQFKGLTITETEYPAPVAVPWHYHENPHFTFFMKGHVLEANKKHDCHCIPGSLIFHHCQDAHYDTKHSDYMHYFHVEFENKWFNTHELDISDFEGHHFFNHSPLKVLFQRIYQEVRIRDTASPVAIEGLLLQAFSQISRQSQKIKSGTPEWIKKLKEFIHDNCSRPMSLELLSRESGKTPVYLSQVFPKYFNATFGQYIRKARIDKATALLSDSHLPLAIIAYETGFSDQSHFIRCFKQIHGMTPTQYIKIVLSP